MGDKAHRFSVVKWIPSGVFKAPPPDIVFVPGSNFFSRRIALPESIEPAEIDGFVELTLESLSPFPVNQLYYGYVVAADASAVFIYAAYRRRLTAGATRDWSGAAFVVPAYLPFLNDTFELDTALILESGDALTVISFRAGRQMPERVISRPIPDVVDDERRGEWVGRTAATLLAGGPAFENKIHRSGSWAVADADTRLSFELLPPDDGSAEAGEVREVPVADLWAMDVRDPDFVRGLRRAARIDGFMWRGFLGIAAALMILLAGEILLVGGRTYLGLLTGLMARRGPEVERIVERQGIVARLAEFDRSNLIPFQMLQSIAPLKPKSVYFTSAKTEGHHSMIIDANTMNVADVNQFESSLRGMDEVQSVEVRNLKSREDGTSFTLVVTFKSGVFENNEADSPVRTASR